jgi:hypothetical protein
MGYYDAVYEPLGAFAPYPTPHAPPTTPMPRSRADQGIGRGAPFTGGLLARQDEATGACAREPHEADRLELATTSPPIEQGAHRLREGSRPKGCHRPARLASGRNTYWETMYRFPQVSHCKLLDSLTNRIRGD